MIFGAVTVILVSLIVAAGLLLLLTKYIYNIYTLAIYIPWPCMHASTHSSLVSPELRVHASSDVKHMLSCNLRLYIDNICSSITYIHRDTLLHRYLVLGQDVYQMAVYNTKHA